MNTIELKNNSPNGRTLVSLFAGCGGSSLGYKATGYDIRLAVEWDKGAASIYRDNFPETTLYEGDIHDLDIDEILDLTRLKPGELDILDGSPPCQGFSIAGKRSIGDSRNQLFNEYIRILQGLKPKTFVMENVGGLIKGKMKIMFSEMTRALEDSGYKVACRKLNAWWYGVPQSRERLIWIGIRNDINGDPSHPQPMFRKPISVRQALGATAGITTGWRGDIKQALLNDKWNDTTRPSPTLIGQRSWIRRTAPIINAAPRPKITIAGSFSFPKNAAANGKDINNPSPLLAAIRPPTLVEGATTRPITIQEAKILQSFPDWFSIEQYKYIGNSVPPLMAQAIGEHMLGILHDK